VRDKYGKLLMKEDKILERWKEHSEEVLNVDFGRIWSSQMALVFLLQSY